LFIYVWYNDSNYLLLIKKEFSMKKNNLEGRFMSEGFTLIELLVVVSIIVILASVVLAALDNARNKGGDAGVKSNLANARAQAEIFFNTNTAAPNTYTSLCTNGTVGGATAIGAFIVAAAKARGLSSPYFSLNFGVGAVSGDLDHATCSVSGLNDAWAAEVPLKVTVGAAKQMWCVDSRGTSRQTGNSIGFGWTCF
jgi:prepilin-type N-terminal cleavage/methylation domain-containing protein